MSVRPIRVIGDPVLRHAAEPVVDFDRELRALVTDLTDTMLDAAGGGLAAPQVGVGLRVFTYHVEDEVGHIVNPVLEFLGDEEQDEDEGCLSIPGLVFPCRRALSVLTRGFTVHGEEITLSGAGRMAVVAQHEVDHLDGVLFVDRLDAETQRAALEAIRVAEWNGDREPDVRLSPHAPLRQ